MQKSNMNEQSQKKFQQQAASQQDIIGGGHSQSNMSVAQVNSGTGDAAQNINSYQKQIKSNNQVFKQSMSLQGHIQTALQQNERNDEQVSKTRISQKQQQPEGIKNYVQQVSPNIDKFRKAVNQPGNQIPNKGSSKEIKYGTQYNSNQKNRNKIGTQPGGQKQLQGSVVNHRRSKTDGNIQIDFQNNNEANSAENQAPNSHSRAQHYQDLNQMMMDGQKLINENLQEQMIQNSFMSRQQAINSNQNLFPKSSNQSAKSAQIQLNQAQKLLLINKQKNDQTGTNGNRNLSVEQAAKNLKLIGGSDDIMAAPTRNSNLISHPNKDKMAKNRINKDASDGSQQQVVGSMNIQNKKILERAQLDQQQKYQQESKQYEIQNQDSSQYNETGGPDDKSGQNISMDQLKELMKNPQIAQFLKEQIEIQQKQQQSSFQNSQDTFGLNSAQRLDLQQVSQMRKDLGDSGERHTRGIDTNQSSNQKIPLGLGHTESNMNSDTSQEIIKYQQEWAKQFHEQVNGMTNIERQELTNMMSANSSKTNGQRSSAMERDQSSSQFITGNPGNSHEQIMMLPESAFTHNMQKLNEKKTDFKERPIQTTKLPDRHGQNLTDNKNPNNIDFYNKASSNNMNESHVESASPISMNYNNAHDRDGGKLGGLNMGPGFEKNLKSVVEQAPMPPNIALLEQQCSRNIMNGGKQLSFITICSDIMDHDAQLILDYIREDSQASQKDEDDEYLTFQLCQGEVMDNEMANFIGIHMLNDGYLEGEENSKNNDQDGGLNYQCQVTGAHFEYKDIHERVNVLLDKRNVIDEAIRQEDERQKLVKNQQVMNEMNKQKQLQKQKKFKTQVQNILKSAQQDNNSNDDFNNELNDSMPNQTNHLITDEDMFVMEDEDHLQSHHVTTNMRTNQVNLENQDNNSNNKNGKQNGNGKIYNTHDGRQKQASEQQSSTKGASTNIIKTQDTFNNQQPMVVSAYKQSGQKTQANANLTSSHNQVKIIKHQTNEHEINPLMQSNKHYSGKAVTNHGHTMQGRFFNGQHQQKDQYSANQVLLKTSNQSMYPTGGSFYQQSMKNNAKTFHVTPGQAVHQASSLASDHASKISQISKNSAAVAGTLTGKSQRIAGNSFGAIGQNHSKGGFAYTQNSGNNSNERQMQRKLQIGGGPSAVKRGGMNVSVGSGTHPKMDPQRQYHLQIKNQQQQDSVNQAIHGSKKKQIEGQHGISVSGHSQQSIAQRAQVQSRDEDSENAFEQISQGLVPQGQQNNPGAVKQSFMNQQDKNHGRVLSDEIKFNTSNLQNNNLQKANVQGGIAGTQIHSNQLSSLDATYAQNTHAYNTALGSQRDTVIQVGKTNAHKHPKKNVTSFDNHKNGQKINTIIGKSSGKARLLENKDSKSLGGTISTQGNSQLRQTAQFGPQMNLIKSQLPNNNVKGNVPTQYHSNDNKMRNQKKIQINNQKVKSTEMRKNSKNTHGDSNNNVFANYFREQYQSQGVPVDQGNMYAGVVLQNQGQQPLQYDESGSLNKRQAMMQQPNQMAFQHNQQILINDKRTSKQTTSYIKNDQKGIPSNKSDKVSMQQQNAAGQNLGQGASIYSSQQQRKQKLIYNGGNLIGYDMGRSSNQNHISQQQPGLGTQVNTYGYGINRNISADRTSQKSKQYNKQNVMLNQIDIKNQSNIAAVVHPKTVQSVSKKFASVGNNGAENSEQASKGETQSTQGQLYKQNASSKVGGLQSLVNQQNMKEAGQAVRSDGHNMGAQVQQLAGPNQAGPMTGSKAQQRPGAGGVGAGNHLQSHSFDFRQQHQSQMNRIGNYTVFRDGNKDEQTHSQAQHSRQTSGIQGDFDGQHAQPRYSHPNQAMRSSNIANNKMQGGSHQQSAVMGKSNLRSFDAQMSNNQHNKLIADNVQQTNNITPGSSNIQTPSQIIQKNKRNVQQQQASINQRNVGSQLGSNISKAKSSSLQQKKDGQSSSNSAVRAIGLHGSDQGYSRYSGGGGNSGKQQLNHIHQSKASQQHDQNLAGPGHFEGQSQGPERGGHAKIKQGQPFGLSAADSKAQANMRSSFNNATERAAGLVQATMGAGGHNQASSGQPNSHSLANTGPNAQTKNAQMGNFDQEEPGPQNRAFGSSTFNTGGNVSMTKENFERGARDPAGQNIAAAIATKTKRLNAANRGINCGTNARVNTFDNRGMQAQQQSQHQKGSTQSSQPQQLLPQMMKQPPPVDPSRGQPNSGSQGAQSQHQRLHSLKNILSNQQQVHPEQRSQMGQVEPQYAAEGSNVVGHQMGDNSGAILINKQNNQARQQPQQQKQFQQSNQLPPGQYSSNGQQNDQQIQGMDQGANPQHQSPILFAKFVNQFFLQ